MKFLNVYCTHRKKEVYINLDKIVLVSKSADDNKCRIDLQGETTAVEVDMPAEELIRRINGEDRIGIGFRRTT